LTIHSLTDQLLHDQVLAVVDKHLDTGLQHKPHIAAANIFAVVLVHTHRVFHKALQQEEKLQLQQAT
jgi:hypothetical protein